MKTINKLNTFYTLAYTLALSTVLLALTQTTKADDIVKGVKGPTKWQLDLRENYIQKSTGGITTTTTINNDIIKYWSGDKLGVFGFANIPAYKTIENKNSNSHGFGDISFGIGPRGKFNLGAGTFNFLSYIGASFPTGKTNCKIALGNNRTDFKAGLYTTILNANKNLELDASIDYTSAGKTPNGAKGLDEIAAGMLIGAKLTENNSIRAALGISAKYKEITDNGWAHTYAARAVVRLTPPKKIWHLELIGEYDYNAKNMPKGYMAAAQLRINL
jgi:hypothetical protein